MKKFLPLLLLLYLPAGNAKTDPSFSWMTLTSPHFLVHYHQGEEVLARRTVVLAEDVHHGWCRASSRSRGNAPTSS